MLSSSLLVFAPGLIKLLSVDVLLTNGGGNTVVFAHKVPLSIAGANQELTRLHDGMRMVFSQTSPLPSSNTRLGGSRREGAPLSKALAESSLPVRRHVSLGWNSKWRPTGKVEEVEKNAEFRSGFLPHLLRFVNMVVYIILRNLYLVLFVSQNI